MSAEEVQKPQQPTIMEALSVIPGAAQSVVLAKAAGKNPLIAIIVVFILSGWWIVARVADVAEWAKPKFEQVITTHLDTVKKLTDNDEKKTIILQALQADVKATNESVAEQRQMLNDVHKIIVKPPNVSATNK